MDASWGIRPAGSTGLKGTGAAGAGRRARAVAILFFATVVVAVWLQHGTALGGKALQPCGDVLKRAPVTDKVQGLPPVVIGDSIAGWAVPELNAVGFRTNTQNCRTFSGGVRELDLLRKRGKVPKLVIMNVGTGGTLRMKQISRAVRLVGAKRTLGLVTPREFKPGFGEAKRDLIRRAANRYDNTILLDWDKASKGHDDWFHWDNLHPVGEGAEALAIFFAIGARHAGVELEPSGIPAS